MECLFTYILWLSSLLIRFVCKCACADVWKFERSTDRRNNLIAQYIRMNNFFMCYIRFFFFWLMWFRRKCTVKENTKRKPQNRKPHVRIVVGSLFFCDRDLDLKLCTFHAYVYICVCVCVFHCNRPIAICQRSQWVRFWVWWNFSSILSTCHFYFLSWNWFCKNICDFICQCQWIHFKHKPDIFLYI